MFKGRDIIYKLYILPIVTRKLHEYYCTIAPRLGLSPIIDTQNPSN